VGERDRDLDGIDDELNERLQLAASDAVLARESTELQVILKTPVEQAQLDAFMADGGKIRYVFRELSYGWTGTLPLDRLKALAARLGEQLHFVAAPRKVVPFLDEATRTGRVRTVWAAGFAGKISGFSGNSKITIAVIDTGVDGTHPDLASRMQGWKDYSPDGSASTRDVEGHGTHVASIALGSGAAFASAGGALKFTQSGNLAGVPSGAFLAAPIHTPTYLSPGSALVASASAKFLGGGSGTLHRLRSADGVSPPTSFGTASGASPVSLSSLDSGTNGMLYQAGLAQAPSGAISAPLERQHQDRKPQLGGWREWRRYRDPRQGEHDGRRRRAGRRRRRQRRALDSDWRSGSCVEGHHGRSRERPERADDLHQYRPRLARRGRRREARPGCAGRIVISFRNFGRR
jgi:hypothetical protein